MRGPPVLPSPKCSRGHPCPSPPPPDKDGWIHPVKSSRCTPGCTVDNKYKIESDDMVVRKIRPKKVEDQAASAWRDCSRSGCLVQHQGGGHPGPCLLFDFAEPKIDEELHGWVPPADMSR